MFSFFKSETGDVLISNASIVCGGEIIINGQRITGSNMKVFGNSVGGYVVVDGVRIAEGLKLDITVNGPVSKLEQSIGNVTVVGNIGDIKATSGSVSVTGNAESINNTSGDVKVGGSVAGSVSTVSGDIGVSGSISGGVKTVSGSIGKGGKI
jgi:hypothetical protein